MYLPPQVLAGIRGHWHDRKGTIEMYEGYVKECEERLCAEKARLERARENFLEIDTFLRDNDADFIAEQTK